MSATTGYERGLLAVFLQNPDMMFQLDVGPQHFENPDLARIFQEMIVLYSEKKVKLNPKEFYYSASPETQLVLKKLSLGQGDGYIWLETALMQPPTTADPFRYQKEIMDDYQRRKLREGAKAIADKVDALPEMVDPNRIADTISTEVDKLYAFALHGGDKSLKAADTDFEQELEVAKKEFEERQRRAGASMGSKDFDSVLQGIPYGRFAVLVADKKIGKSTMLQNLAVMTAVGKQIMEDEVITFNPEPEPILFLDNEMNYEMDVKTRLYSIVSGVKRDFIDNRSYTKYPDMVDRMRRAHQIIKGATFIFEKVPECDLGAIRSSVRRAKAKYGVRRVFFDYIKRPSATENNWIHLGNFAKELNVQVAKDQEVALFAAAQANAQGEVAGSRDIARECDILFKLLYLNPTLYKFYIDDSRFTKSHVNRSNGEVESYFEVLCELESARMRIGDLVHGGANAGEGQLSGSGKPSRPRKGS